MPKVTLTFSVFFCQVDGLTKSEEEGYNYEHYYGNKPYQNYGKDYK